VGRPRVNESLKQSFIKIILTKDQRRSKEDKNWMKIRKGGYVELDRTCYYTHSFQSI